MHEMGLSPECNTKHLFHNKHVFYDKLDQPSQSQYSTLRPTTKRRPNFKKRETHTVVVPNGFKCSL